MGIAEFAELRVESFHDLILSNETSVFEKAYHATHVDELERTSHWKDAIEVKKTEMTEALSAKPHSLPGIVESYFFGWLGFWHDVWINVCGVLVSLYTLAIVMYCCLPNGVVRPMQRLQQRWIRRRNQDNLSLSTVEIADEAESLDQNPQNIGSINSIEMQPLRSRSIIKSDNSAPKSRSSRRRSEQSVRFCNSVYEPTVYIETPSNFRKSRSEEKLKRESVITIGSNDEPEETKLARNSSQSSMNTWAHLFKPATWAQNNGFRALPEPVSYQETEMLDFSDVPSSSKSLMKTHK